MNEPTVAWIGLGRMGSVMASLLLDAGTPLSVWNRTTAREEALVERGAARLRSLAAAATCDVAFSMVRDDHALPHCTTPTRVSSPVPPTDAGCGNPGVVESGNAIFAISSDEAGLDIAEVDRLRTGR